MSDDLAELKDLIPLTEVPKLLPRRGGKKVHIKTVRRWVLKGLKGRRLRAVRVGGRYYVSKACLHEFLNPVRDKSDTPVSQSRAFSTRRLAERTEARRRAREIFGLPDD